MELENYKDVLYWLYTQVSLYNSSQQVGVSLKLHIPKCVILSIHLEYKVFSFHVSYWHKQRIKLSCMLY